MYDPFNPFYQQFNYELIKNMPKPKTTMGDDEFSIQLIKIFLGFVLGVVVIALLWHINWQVNNIRNLIANELGTSTTTGSSVVGQLR